MLTEKNRLRHKKDFESIFGHGLKAYGNGLGLRFGKRYKPEAPVRIGFMVGTKVSKEAVVRNKLKRRMREVAREIVMQLPPGLDLVFIAFPEARDYKIEQVREQMVGVLKKAKLLP
ncbi:MAG: ribonuclease P protein component [bacterium]